MSVPRGELHLCGAGVRLGRGSTDALQEVNELKSAINKISIEASPVDLNIAFRIAQWNVSREILLRPLPRLSIVLSADFREFN